MARHRGPVLVDTNAIVESFRAASWRALTGGYRVETVEDCVIETQTGFQRRRPEQQIDAGALRASLAAVHPVLGQVFDEFWPAKNPHPGFMRGAASRTDAAPRLLPPRRPKALPGRWHPLRRPEREALRCSDRESGLPRLPWRSARA
jgi:hypothetical protein